MERQRRREEAEAREAREAAEAEAREAAEAEARTQAAEREAAARALDAQAESLRSEFENAARERRREDAERRQRYEFRRTIEPDYTKADRDYRSRLAGNASALRSELARIVEPLEKANDELKKNEESLQQYLEYDRANNSSDPAKIEEINAWRRANNRRADYTGEHPFIPEYRSNVAKYTEPIRDLTNKQETLTRQLKVAERALELAGGPPPPKPTPQQVREAAQREEQRKLEEASRRFVKEKQKAEELERMERESKARQREREMREARVFTKAEWRALPDLDFVNNTMVKIPSIYGDVVMRYKAKDGKFYILGPE